MKLSHCPDILLATVSCFVLSCGSSTHVVTVESEPLLSTTQPSDEALDAAPADIEQFMQILSASGPMLTTSGDIYYRTWSTGVDQLYRVSSDGEDSAQLTDFPEGVDFYSLSPDGDWAVIGISEGGSEIADLYLLNAVSGEVTQVVANPEVRYDSPLWERDSSGFFFRSNEGNGTDFFIYHFELGSDAHELLYESEGYNSLSDTSVDGTRLLVTRYLSNMDSQLFEYDLTTSPVTETQLNPHEGEAMYTDAAYAGDGSVWLVSNWESELLQVGTLNPDFSGAVTYRTTGQWEVEGMVMSSDQARLAYTTNEAGYAKMHLIDVATGLETTPDLLNDGIVQLGDFRGRQLSVVFSSPTRTGDVWTVDVVDQTAAQHTFSDYAGVDRELFRDPELVQFTSFDGLEVPAFLYLPPNYEGGVVPTIIHVHGGPEAQFRPYFIRHFQYLMLNGFAVFAPNVRGSSGYGHAYMQLDNYTNRLDSVRDIGAAADWLIAEGYSDEAHLGIKGGSYGGYMVMAAITEMPGRFAAAEESVGIVNFVTFLENTADYRRALREAEYGPLTDSEFLASISPIHKIDQIQTPLLVIHGENDSRVPVGEARQIIEALESRNQPVQALIFADEGHGVRHLHNRLTLYRQSVEFFTRYLVDEATP